MRLDNAPRLFDLCKNVSTKAIFNHLIDINCKKEINNLLRGFIVNACLPKALLLQIVRLLLVYLDRGYNRYNYLHPPCEDASRDGEITEPPPRSIHEGDVNDLGRRQRASWITAACVHHLVSRWGEDRLYPQDLLKDDGIAPRAMSMRGRQTVVMNMVESFIKWTNVVASGAIKMCSKCACQKIQWPRPPKVLNLRAEHGNWSGTRVALAAISSSVKAPDTLEEDDVNPHSQCVECDCQCTAFPLGSSHDYKIPIGQIFERPVIKLDVVLMGAIQDWVVDVLLYVLRHSPEKGFNIEISAIRSEDVDIERFCKVIDSLAMPGMVKSLEYRTKDPASIFSAAKFLQKLSGLETFVFAHLWRQSKYRTKLTTEECLNLGEEILGKWKQLSKVRVEGIVLFSDFSTKNGQGEGIFEKQRTARVNNFLPLSVRILEFAHGSLAAETLQWLVHLCGHRGAESKSSLARRNLESVVKPANLLNKVCTMRFDNETILGSGGKPWEMFLDFIRRSRCSLRTLVLDHCDINEPQGVALQSAMVTPPIKSAHACSKVSAESNAHQSPLEHLTIREPALSAEATIGMFNSYCAATKYRILPNFSYFAALLPPKSDPFWSTKSTAAGKTESEVVCPFEKRLKEISNAHGCPHVSFDAFWEPSEEDDIF